MLLKPWYDVITPRKDLYEAIIPQALETGLRLDKVRHGQAIDEYANPEHFLARTHLTSSLLQLSTQVLRRLSGEFGNAPAVFHLSSDPGEGKTHALTLLYHLANHGANAQKWSGVPKILNEAALSTFPKARIAAFVGSEFTSRKGLGGKRGEPLRKTPWGEIAFQLGGKETFEQIAEYDMEMKTPDAESIQRILPADEPCLILIDDVMAYKRHVRDTGILEQCFGFFRLLSEYVHNAGQIALVVALPSSPPDEDSEEILALQAYQDSLKHLSTPLDIANGEEIADIIRHRLFDWEVPETSSPDGRVPLPDDAVETCLVHAAWVRKYHLQLPSWFPFESADQVFMNAYPFHPSALSVFRRKWAKLPHFEHTRGILYLMALLIATVYKEGYSRVYPDPLISLGAAPLDDPEFRAAVRSQLGDDSRLETAIMTDICGRNAFALRLDNTAEDEIKHNRLHLKAATTIFFESHGGIPGDAAAKATEPEIRFAVEEPDLRLEHVKQVLDNLADHCYYLTREDLFYYVSLTPNVNKAFADRCANIDEDRITEQMREAIKTAFPDSSRVIFFPEKSEDVPDEPALTLAVLSPEYSRKHAQTVRLIENITHYCGEQERQFRSAIIWVVADDEDRLNDEARTFVTWRDICDEVNDSPDLLEELSAFDPVKIRAQINAHLERTRQTLQEIVWQSYRHIALLTKEHSIQFPELGQFEAHEKTSLVDVIFHQLRLYDYIVESVSPRFLARNWPEEFQHKAWSTRAVQDMFFSSPQFPRVLDVSIINETIAKGVSNGYFAYAGPKIEDKYEPFYYQKVLMVGDVEISDDRYLLTPDIAEAYLSGIVRPLKSLTVDPPRVDLMEGEKLTFRVHAMDENGEEIKKNVLWEATGGHINENGVLTVEEKDRGDLEVRATAGDQSAWIKLKILPKTLESEEVPAGQTPAEPATGGIHAEEAPPTHLLWSGEVTGKNLEDVYKKVFARFAAEHTMKLVLNVEILREEGIAPEDIEAMKTALRSAGLHEEVEEKG